MRVALVLLSTVVLVAAMVAPVRSEMVESPARYQETLERAIEAIERGQRAGREERRAAFATAADALAEVRLVIRDGEAIAVDLSSFVAELRSDEPRSAEVVRGLRVLLGKMTSSPMSPADEERARQALSVTLARPEFGGYRPAPWEEAMASFLAPLGRAVEQVLSALAGVFDRLGRGFTAGSPVLALVGLAALALVAIWVGMRLRGQMVPGGSLAGASLGPSELDSDGLFRLAEHYAGLGEWRVSARYLFLSTLAFYLDRRLLPRDDSLTDREYLAYLREKPAPREAWSRLVAAFEPLWYGYRPAGEQDYRRLRELAARAREAAEQ